MANSKKSILVVEDSMPATKVAKFLFEKLGCHVECVGDGEIAVDLAKKNHYDGICMDIGLPTISGIEACLAIRDYETKNGLSPIPIVAVTGNCSPDEIKEYKAAGMQEVIEKPLTKDKAEYFLTFC